MTNSEVIEKFVKKQTAHGSSLYSTGVRLVHYCTTIAEWKYNEMLVNVTKYSASTSKWRNELLYLLDNRSKNKAIRYKKLDNIPINTNSLI